MIRGLDCILETGFPPDEYGGSACRIIFSPSTRERPRRAPSCSMPRWRRSRPRSRNSPQIYPAPGLVEHDPEAIWTTTVATVRAAHGEGGRRRKGHRRARHHQSARDHDRLGPGDRPTHPQRHRLAGPPHGRRLRGAAAGRARDRDRGSHRAAARSLFLRHQDRLAARSRRGRARGGARPAGSPSAPSTVSCSGG